MAQANSGAAGENEVVPQVVDGAVPLVNGAVPRQTDGARIRAAVQAAAPVAGPLVADVAGALFPQGLVPVLYDVDGVLLGPLPTKNKESCKIFPKIADESGP